MGASISAHLVRHGTDPYLFQFIKAHSPFCISLLWGIDVHVLAEGGKKFVVRYLRVRWSMVDHREADEQGRIVKCSRTRSPTFFVCSGTVQQISFHPQLIRAHRSPIEVRCRMGNVLLWTGIGKDPHSRNDMQDAGDVGKQIFSIAWLHTAGCFSSNAMSWWYFCGFLLLHKQLFKIWHAPVVTVYITFLAFYIEARQIWQKR